jgi:excisionase family DNA binding protein
MTPDEVREIVDERLGERLKDLFLPRQNRFIKDDHVCDLLNCSKSKLRELIASGELVQGAHFTGSGKRRLWMRDRVERYIETRDNPSLQRQDLKKWARGS